MSAVETAQGASEDKVTDEQQPARAEKPGLVRRIALGAGRIPGAVRIATVVVLVALIAVSAFGAWYWANQTSSAAATQADRDAAVAAAKTEIPQILTYNYKTLSQDLATASADTTGQFSGEFSVMAREMITPQATRQQTVTKAAAPVVAAVDSTGNQVTVLAFVNQSTTNKQQAKAQVTGSELRVTMQKVGSRWLVAQFTAQ